jgi:hypothetical protein
VFEWGDPIWVPRDLEADGFEARRRALERALIDVTSRADRCWEKAPDRA